MDFLNITHTQTYKMQHAVMNQSHALHLHAENNELSPFPQEEEQQPLNGDCLFDIRCHVVYVYLHVSGRFLAYGMRYAYSRVARW